MTTRKSTDYKLTAVNYYYKEKYIKYKNKYLELKQNHNLLIGGSKKYKNKKQKQEIKKLVNEQLLKIDYIKIQLQPYLQYGDDNNDFKKIENIDEKLEKIFKKKLDKNYKNIITNAMLFDMKIIKYQYNSESNIVNIYVEPELKYIQYWNNHILTSVESFNLEKVLTLYAGNILYELEQGEQHWLDGDAVYIKKKEYDNKEYIIFANLYSCSLYYDNETKIIGYNCDITKNKHFNDKCAFFLHDKY
jgi:hypothetical protein